MVMIIEIDRAVRDNPESRRRSEAAANARLKKLGIRKLRKMFEATPIDRARGRALDKRVREQLLKGLCD